MNANAMTKNQTILIATGLRSYCHHK